MIGLYQRKKVLCVSVYCTLHSTQLRCEYVCSRCGLLWETAIEADRVLY